MIHNWLYKVVKLDEENLDVLEEQLNKFGADGWELISFDGEIGVLKRRQLYLVNPWQTEEKVS